MKIHLEKLKIEFLVRSAVLYASHHSVWVIEKTLLGS